MRVDFLIVGTQRGGTTALASFLRQHQEICFSKQREVHFFDNEEFFKGNRSPYDLYHQSFGEAAKCKVIGENTPIYMYWKPAAQRIFEYNSQMKLIFILRNPIDRAYSAYHMELQRNMEHVTFSEAIRLEKTRCKEAAPFQHRVYSYCDRGFYSRQIKRMLDLFPRENMLFLKNEELKNDHASTLKRIFHFLGVDTSIMVEPKEVFSHEYDDMSKEDERFLKNKFLEEIKELEKLLGWDCSAWSE